MKKILLVVFVFNSIISFSQSKEADAVNQLHKKKFGWMINKKYDSLDLVLDPQIKFIHSNGWIQSKTEMIDDLKSGKLNYTDIDVRESSARLFNQTVVITGKGTFKGLMPDKSEFNINLLYTEVYVKTKKQWRLVSRQATKI
jgi:hypothetical protein